MIRAFVKAVLALMLLASGSVPPMVVADAGALKQVPRSAIVEILLLKAPGLNTRGSKWEVAYELRLTNEAGLWEASKARKFNGTGNERVGELLKEETVAESLELQTGRKLLLEIPFNEATLERLRNQPKNRLNIAAAAITPESIDLLKEQELRSQVFMLYSIVSIHDAKLKKTLVIPVSRGWDFADYPEARFEIRIEITGENSYSWNSSPPKKPQ